MTRLMRELIEKLEALPEAEQDALAREFLHVIEAGAAEGDVYVLTPEQEEEVRRALEDGEPVLEEEEARRFLRGLGA
ncbi:MULTISPECIES: hypothetical protein [Xanthobacter]|jgi:hypothetical protein|uniref:hypothetical protein n=1 Tax=Xanthobacter TaxID=279 RepID=UPI00045EA9ED|nr:MULTISPECIES: hypothetical protein [Xanthobacter]MCL8381620.1 hypothetical protein [Xanthobacter aminoxidans]